MPKSMFAQCAKKASFGPGTTICVDDILTYGTRAIVSPFVIFIYEECGRVFEQNSCTIASSKDFIRTCFGDMTSSMLVQELAKSF